jgi:5'-phosphate synthase pdxT subunit
MSKRIGILALQGDFAEHLRAFGHLDCDPVAVKRPDEVLGCDALVIPGGESTTIGKLCQRFGVGESILELNRRGRPIWGTCAGMILLAREIAEGDQWRLGLMDITVRRNAFGRQVDSFEVDVPIEGISGGPVRAVFIRAPFVTEVGENVQVMARFGDKIVMVRQGNLLASAFHPELTDDRRVQQYFLGMV